MVVAVVVIGVIMIILLLLNLAGHGIDVPRLQ
jgi:hypothetical protein